MKRKPRNDKIKNNPKFNHNLAVTTFENQFVYCLLHKQQ